MLMSWLSSTHVFHWSSSLQWGFHAVDNHSCGFFADSSAHQGSRADPSDTLENLGHASSDIGNYGFIKRNVFELDSSMRMVSHSIWDLEPGALLLPKRTWITIVGLAAILATDLKLRYQLGRIMKTLQPGYLSADHSWQTTWEWQRSGIRPLRMLQVIFHIDLAA